MVNKSYCVNRCPAAAGRARRQFEGNGRAVRRLPQDGAAAPPRGSRGPRWPVTPRSPSPWRRRYPAAVSTASPDTVTADFIARWQAADGSELANYQLFVHQLAELLGVDQPQPSREDTRDNAYGWNDLAAELVGKPGATTPWPEKPAAQAEAEEELLVRLVKLNAERAAEEARGVVRWVRPEFQARQAVATQTEITEEEAPAAAKPVVTRRASWPATLPEQIRLVADTVTLAAAPLDFDQLADRFTGRGPWKKRLPDIVESLAALGRIKVERVGGKSLLHG